MHYNGFRYYDPKVGQYASADPLGQWDSPNVYRYALNNPLARYDPLGLNNFGGPIVPAPSSDSYLEIYEDARGQAKKEFQNPPGTPPGKESAARSDFRHCFASCELGRQHSGFESKALGELNECVYGNDPEREDLFDKAANEAGRKIAEKAESRDDCLLACRAFAGRGRPSNPPVPTSRR